MLAKSDFPIQEAIRVFSRYGVEAAYFVPTATALKKSIIDAHAEFRNFLKTKGIHDYRLQGLGNGEHGVSVPVTLIEMGSTRKQNMSLYRPKTKKGDPRFWTNLNGFATENNLLALFCDAEKNLYLVNCSNGTLQTIETENSPLNEALYPSSESSESSEKLLNLLREIAKMGWVDSTKTGDTAVGHTLETLLGIKANSSKRPDFLNQIELKSGRVTRSKSKKSLFSRVPDWSKSPYSPIQILREFGSTDASGILRLAVTVSNKPNPQGLFLVMEEDSGLVIGKARKDATEVDVVVWQIENLQTDLKNKHKETYWVDAETRTVDGKEQFKFFRVRRTKLPLVGNLSYLLQSGVVTMDFTLSQKPSGAVRDHGYLFRIDPRNFELLFPSIETILL